MFETDSGLQAVAKKRLWLWSSVVRLSQLMKCWTVCVGIGYSQHLMWFCLTTVLVILVALTKWEFRKAGLYLKLDADVNMCNLLDSPSVHAYVWRPLDFRAPLRWKEANLVKSINTSLPVYIMENLFSLTWVMMQWSKAGAKVKFPSTHDGISINTWWNSSITRLHHVTLVQR